MSCGEAPIVIHDWLNNLKDECDIRVIMVEKVHNIQGASSKSNFNFGYNVGSIRAIAECSGCTVDLITPKKWQKFIGVTKKGSLIKKDVASICERLYPKANIRGPRGGLLDGLSDSLMIAHYAAQTYKLHT